MRSFMTGRLLLVCVLLGFSAAAQTYTTSVADGTMPIGIAPSAAYPLTGLEHYDSFSGSLNPSVPLHHIGGRGEAGFDLVWNLQQTWIAAKRFGGSNPFIPIDPYPDANVSGPQGVAGPLGAGVVFNRTGSTFGPCSTTNASAVTATLARIIFEEPNGTQLELVSTQNAGFYSLDACSQTPASVDAGRGELFRSTEGGMVEFLADSKVLDYTSPGYGEADTIISGNLLFPNGTTYRIDNSVVSWIRDS